MQTAKLFVNGASQAVRLPKECRFNGNEVGIKKVGNMVLLFQKEEAWDNFCNCQPVSDDFVEAILENRNNEIPSPRVSL